MNEITKHQPTQLPVQSGKRIIGKQRSVSTIGELRAGREKESGKLGRAINNWRVTSKHAHILENVAKAYGGQVVPWKDGPSPGYFQVYTEASHLNIVVAPKDYWQRFEVWGGGSLKSECDGVTCLVKTKEGDKPQSCTCQAKQDLTGIDPRIGDGGGCKLVTRFWVMLEDIPDVGAWMVETSSHYSSEELPGVLDTLLKQAQGRENFLSAKLFIEARTRTSVQFGKRNFNVIGISVSLPEGMTMGALMSGRASAIDATYQPAAIETVQAPAIEHRPAPAADAETGEIVDKVPVTAVVEPAEPVRVSGEALSVDPTDFDEDVKWPVFGGNADLYLESLEMTSGEAAHWKERGITANNTNAAKVKCKLDVAALRAHFEELLG